MQVSEKGVVLTLWKPGAQKILLPAGMGVKCHLDRSNNALHHLGRAAHLAHDVDAKGARS